MNALIISAILSASLQSDFPFSHIPNYHQLKEPVFQSVPVETSDSRFDFHFQGIDFSIAMDSTTKAKPNLLLERGRKLVASFELNTVYPAMGLPDVRVFDADENGLLDLFIAYEYGPSGRNSSIKLVDAFFFFADSTFNFHELSSFYGSYELFRDFNNDGKIEFACIKYDRTKGAEFLSINLFSMTNGQFRNVSESRSGYPLFIQVSEKGDMHALKNRPAFLEEHSRLEKPSVFE